MVLMRAQGHIPVRRQRKDGTNGTDGAQGYSIVTSVTRNNFTEAQWATYGTTGHTENWSNTSSIRNGARVGDLFTVVGTATDTGNGHTATYRCDNASGDLHGVCISHEISNAGKDSLNATITKNVGVVECNANGVTTAEKTVDANVSFEKGGVAQTITGIVCKINDTTEIGTSYAPDGAAANFKKSTTLNTGYVQITIKSGTSLVTPVKIVITVSASINGTTQNRKVTLTIQGSVPGQKGDQGKIGRWYEYAGEYGKDLAATLSNTDSHGWWVKRGNNCFQLIASSGTTVQTSTIPTTATGNATWELMAGDTRKLFIGAAFFGAFANFGAFIINEDWMISQYGTLYAANGTATVIDSTNYQTLVSGHLPYTYFDSEHPNSNVSGSINFCPTLALNGKTGKGYLKDLFVRGEFEGLDGCMKMWGERHTYTYHSETWTVVQNFFQMLNTDKDKALVTIMTDMHGYSGEGYVGVSNSHGDHGAYISPNLIQIEQRDGENNISEKITIKPDGIDITLEGTDYTGVTQDVVVGNKTLKFIHGILVQVT